MIVGHIGGGAVASGGVDTGDIPASLRFRGRSASAYASKTFGTPASQNSWAFSCWVKFSEMPNGSNYQPLLSAGSVGTSTWPGETLHIYQDGTLAYYASTVSGTHSVTKRSSRVFREPTSWVHIFVRKTAAANSGLTFVRLWVNNEEVTSWAVNTYTGTQASVPDYINVASTSHVLGRNHLTEYLQGYMSRVCFVDNGGSLLPTDFIQFNTEINEWVSKSQSAVKAVVDAGGTNSFMLDFDDPNFATYNVGKDYSSKGNHWTPNNFSLTAGVSYDYMKSVPGNTYCIASEIDKGANPASTTLTEAGLKSVCAAVAGGSSVCGTMGIPEGKFYFELTPTAIGNGIILGITSRTSGAPSGSVVGYVFDGNKNIAGSGSAYGATYAANDVIGVAVDTTANTIEFFKNNVSQGVITNATYVVPGCKPLHWNNSSSGSSTVQHNYGQAPLHASATYHSAAGGYFRYAPPTGYKALCQRNMPDPAILNPENGFVSVTATEDNIYSTLASARSGWTDYVDILKNRAAAESWAWQFSHDSSNEYAVSASSLVRQTKRTQSGSNNWVGYSIRIGSTYGTAAGSVSHTNGAATTITHNIGKSARQLILLFNRAGGSAVPVYHPDLTSGELLDLCTTAADAASTAITSVGTNSFQIGSGVATGTYDYLVCSEISQFFDLGKWTGNAAADGAYYNADHKPKMLYAKSLSTTDDHRVYDDLRPGYNVQGGVVLANTNAAETTAAEMDITAFGMKARIATTPNAAQTYVTASWASVASKYSLAR